MVDPDVIAKIAERKIQEAIDEGKFDNLPGKGKPLVFDDDPVTPSHLRLANRVLKNAGVLPDWLQVQKDIIAERQEAQRQRERLIRENEKRRARVAGLAADHALVMQYAQWHARSRAAYLRRIKSVNDSILKFCLMAPSTAEPFMPYRIKPETEAFDAEFPSLEGQPAVESTPAEQEHSRVKSLARERYQQGGGPVRGWLAAAGRLERGTAKALEAEAEEESVDA